MPSDPRSCERVLLLGWDAADWRIIHPLLDAGKLPNLEGLLNDGVMGNLATLHPILSPMLWTSIATGVRPHKHGVLGFTEPCPDGQGQRPVTSLSRRVKAVWNMLCESGLRCNVVGWWPSHPVEPIDGAMVSNHYPRAVGPLEKGWPLPPGTIHPPELAEALAECRLHPGELIARDLLPFVPRAAEVNQDEDPRLAGVAKTLAEATSIHAAATLLMDETDWDFTAVYYDAIDHFCHGFMKYHPPRRPFVSERDFELYSGVVEAGYRYHDMMLGTLLAKAGEHTAVVLVSDHGFHPDHLRPDSIPLEPAGPAVEHRDFGILAMRGPGLRRDEIVHGASLLDVTPTVLTLFELPVGDDMDGKPLVTAFQEPPEIARIPSWEDRRDEGMAGHREHRAEFGDAREAVEQLVALGYVEAPEEGAAAQAASAEREQRFNMARSLMNAAQHADAAPILAALRQDKPGELRFGIHLALCHRALGQVRELGVLVEELIERRGLDAAAATAELARLENELQEMRRERASTHGKAAASQLRFDRATTDRIRRLRHDAVLDEGALSFLRGVVHSAEGRPAEALEQLRRAEQARPGRPVLHIQVGETYLQMKQWEDAERSFARALEIDPENPHAALGIARSLLPRRRNRAAAEAALRTVALLYEYPLAHYCLGVALHRMGRVERAVEALEVAVAQNPNFLEAHLRLARIFRRRLKQPERAAPHEEAALSIQYGIRAEAADVEAPSPEPRTQPSAPQRPRRAVPADPSPVVTVVSGLPRSGTSLMMQMLRAGGIVALSDGARAADADNPRGYFELERVKALRRDASWVDEARGRAVKVIAPLLPHLPSELDYRVVFMERDLGEVLASQAVMLERRGRTGSRGSDTRLAATFERQLGEARRLLARRGVPTHFVRYAELVEKPRRAASELAAFLGGPLDVEAMAAVVEPDLHRQRASRPVSKRQTA